MQCTSPTSKATQTVNLPHFQRGVEYTWQYGGTASHLQFVGLKKRHAAQFLASDWSGLCICNLLCLKSKLLLTVRSNKMGWFGSSLCWIQSWDHNRKPGIISVILWV